jgi:hypothetical protein
MRQSMHPFPGRHWPAIAEGPQTAETEGCWWKFQTLDAWLRSHPELTSVAWFDDHLRADHRVGAQRRLAGRAGRARLLAPKTRVGLTPAHLRRLQEWTQERSSR